MKPEDLCGGGYSMKDYETTQGTFHCRYLNSYSEVTNMIQELSKRKQALMGAIEEEKSSPILSHTQLLTKLKGSNVTKKDNVEVFMNLLHLTREGKIQMRQEKPQEFSPILIFTKNQFN
jgi:chromatin segregation and condensation protein Rec8/ScpA/Scc1 (kleisin family)